ncbi:MAG: glycosyltransferase family 4 protein [Chthoniobacter sp.]|nr:glycosyltransferase family 4 protein [Chthoniobacter sp.]
MKILLASSSSGSRGGGELYLVYLGRALAQRGHAVTLWASTHARMDELANTFSGFGQVVRSDYENTYDQRGRSITSHLGFGTARRVARVWREAEPEVIHINKQNLEDGLDLLRAAQHTGLPHLCTLHLTQSARYLRARLAAARDFVSRRALRHYPGLLVTVLENRERDLTDFLGPSPRIRMIPNGVPLFDLSRRSAVRATKRAELGFGTDDQLFIAVGRMVPQKRPLIFLEKARQILRERPGAKFLWVGDGALSAEWDAQVAAHGLGGAVRRLPWHNDVQSLLLAADVFLHVAEFEGLPLAILEAMSAALPCSITANLLGEMPFMTPTNSIAIGDDDAWLAPLGDPASLRALGAAARALAEKSFSFEKMAASYEALYRETLATHP